MLSLRRADELQGWKRDLTIYANLGGDDSTCSGADVAEVAAAGASPLSPPPLDDARIRKQIVDMQAQQQALIRLERFEECAGLRDTIQALEAQLEAGGLVAGESRMLQLREQDARFSPVVARDGGGGTVRRLDLHTPNSSAKKSKGQLGSPDGRRCRMPANCRSWQRRA